MDHAKQTQKRLLKRYLIIAVGLLIAYFPNYINPLLRWFDIPFFVQGPPSILVWNWLAVGVLTLYILFVERQKLSSIRLLKPTGKDIEWAFYFWGIAMTWYWISTTIFPPSSSNTGADTITSLALPVVVLIVITTACTEEFLWRGYVVERLGKLTGKIWLGALISFCIFLIPHIVFFGPSWLLYNSIGTVLIYALYIWRRNLWSTIVLHFLINAPIIIPTALT